jgi:hypothetical protein
VEPRKEEEEERNLPVKTGRETFAGSMDYLFAGPT